MGELANAAKRNSNFLRIQKGETVLVRYDGYRLIPNKQDPNKEVAQYIVNDNGAKKFWDNSNSKIMFFFDVLPIGSWVKITRGKALTPDGLEDTTKSTYTVEKVEENKAGEGKAWDE